VLKLNAGGRPLRQIILKLLGNYLFLCFGPQVCPQYEDIKLINSDSVGTSQTKEVFLIGEGFSKGNSESMPLMDDLIRQNFDQDVGSRFGHWLHIDNFEEVLTYLSERAPWENESESLRISTERAGRISSWISILAMTLKLMSVALAYYDH